MMPTNSFREETYGERKERLNNISKSERLRKHRASCTKAKSKRKKKHKNK